MHDDQLLQTSPELHELRAAFARAADDAPWPRAKGCTSRATHARAELDLLGVHHGELARVLSRAVIWLERRTAGRRLAAFQKRAAGAVAAARDSGAWVPSAVERVAHKPMSEWPSKRNLARTAFDLDPSSENEALLLRVQAVAET